MPDHCPYMLEKVKKKKIIILGEKGRIFTNAFIIKDIFIFFSKKLSILWSNSPEVFFFVKTWIYLKDVMHMQSLQSIINNYSIILKKKIEKENSLPARQFFFILNA